MFKRKGVSVVGDEKVLAMDSGGSDYLVPVNYADYKTVHFMCILPHIFSVLVWLTLHFFG